MATIRIVYATSEGQTAKVADRIADVMMELGHEVEAIDVERDPAGAIIDTADAVLVGASIHLGKHQPAIQSFIEANRDAMATKPSGFFQLSLSSAVGDDQRQAEAASYVEELLEATDWHPDRIGIFGGALRYSEYGFIKRAMMKKIAKDATGDTDTSRDYEYTDWEEVEGFAKDFVDFVDGRTSGSSVPPEDGA